MAAPDDVIAALREALRVSPTNLPLRMHLAATLLGYARAEEAAEQYRKVVELSPNDPAPKLGLAEACFQLGKSSQALVIIEDLIKRPDAAARAYILHARLLMKSGDNDRASRQYRKAVETDPTVADGVLAQELGVGIGGDEEAPFDDDEDERIRVPRDDAGPGVQVDLERPEISFADVGGMDGVKEEIRMKIIHPLTHPEIYAAYGKKIGGGILMYGPPGCGKTHLARATAGEVKASFIPVGIHDVLDMWQGASEQKLHELFEMARRNKPCVMFFDEVDALGASRTDMRHSSGRLLINQFLAELDGVKSSNEGVLILAATNAPWHLDSAFRRPGRFDRVLFIPPPDEPARASILRIMLKGKPTKDVDHDHLAKKMDGFSGADLKAVVDMAIEEKLREAMAKGVPGPLTSKELLNAGKSIKPSTKEWFSTARNYALYSNQGGVYDDILQYLKIK